MTKRLVASPAFALALALALSGCAQPAPDFEVPPAPDFEVPFDIITGDASGTAGLCMMMWSDGVFISFDPEYGTVTDQWRQEDGGGTPIAWPIGYTARRFGDEVRVYAPGDGRPAAVTGMKVDLQGPTPVTAEHGWRGDPLPKDGAIFVCEAKVSEDQTSG